MCIKFIPVFKTCGHVMKPVTWICPHPGASLQQSQRREIRSDEDFCPLFCPDCLQLPDPRDCTRYQDLGQEWPIQENKKFFEDANSEVQEILKRAEKLGLDEAFTNFEFVIQSLSGNTRLSDGIVPDIPYLGATILELLMDIHGTLSASFWFLIEGENSQSPTLAHGVLLIQIQNFLMFSNFAQIGRKEYRTQATSEERMSRFQNLVTSVPLDSLDGEDQSCNICRERFDGKEDGEQKDNGDFPDTARKTEIPIRTSCGAGSHIFGQNCLHHWLETHESCPSCRHPILPFKLTEREHDAIEEEAAKTREIPKWIPILLGFEDIVDE
jgi:hypothetical protein